MLLGLLKLNFRKMDEQDPNGGSTDYGGAIGAAIGTIGSLIVSNQQETSNEHAAQHQLDAQRQMQNEQNAYNTPEMQIKRFQDAGLNPNLIYGQGTPGNQPSSVNAPEWKARDYSQVMGNISSAIPLFNQTRLATSQVAAQNARTAQTMQLAELEKMQTQVTARNPLLNDDGFKAVIDGLKLTAANKAQDLKTGNISNWINSASAGWQVQKVQKEVDLLEQRFKLGQADQQIKSQVVKSKEFQNAILEVQKKFMVDGDIDSQHIYQFISLLLQKML